MTATVYEYAYDCIAEECPSSVVLLSIDKSGGVSRFCLGDARDIFLYPDMYEEDGYTHQGTHTLGPDARHDMTEPILEHVTPDHIKGNCRDDQHPGGADNEPVIVAIHKGTGNVFLLCGGACAVELLEDAATEDLYDWHGTHQLPDDVLAVYFPAG